MTEAWPKVSSMTEVKLVKLWEKFDNKIQTGC
jgi:hypothetical protein